MKSIVSSEDGSSLVGNRKCGSRAQGRPSLPAEDVRSVTIRFRVTEGERDLLKQLAADAERGLSDWIRDRIYNYLRTVK